MKFALKNLVVAAAFVAAGAANAADLTLTTGGSVTDQGWTVSGLTGSGTLSFSPLLLQALVAGSVAVEGVAPAVATIDGSLFDGVYNSVTAAAPITSLTGSFDGTTVTVNQVATAGGALQTAYEDGFTNTGGTLAITNLRVDLGAKLVYADLEGGNGVGLKQNIALWNIANISGPTSFTAVEGTITSVNELTGLSITSEAFGYFTQSLGIIEGGLGVLASITDYGSISSTITVTATPAIPEPSTYALMGVGLLGVSLVARRRAK